MSGPTAQHNRLWLHKIRSAMHLYTAKVVWNQDSHVFVDGQYSRLHSIAFDG